jgi:hypothetical protein
LADPNPARFVHAINHDDSNEKTFLLIVSIVAVVARLVKSRS